MCRNAIVVGAARSGTSLAAAIFARKGYYVGEIAAAHLREGDDHNPFGYFEADALVNANVEIFRRVGHPYANPWVAGEPPLSAESVAKIAQLPPHEPDRCLVARFTEHAPWVWKDPRLCHTLPYWWRLMDADQTGVLLVRRDPTEIYWSFVRMGWCSPEEERIQDLVVARIEQHVTAATRAIESLRIPHVAVDYHEYRESPKKVARRVGEFFGVDLSVDDLNYRAELNHNTWRGRIATRFRNQLKRLPRNPLRTVERLLPRRLVAVVFPERKFTDDRAAESRANGH